SPRRPDRGGPPYPELDAIIGLLSERAGRLLLVPAGELAAELGNQRVANVVLLGALSTVLDLPIAAWEAALHERVPSRFLELNRRAFSAGRGAAGAEPAAGRPA